MLPNTSVADKVSPLLRKVGTRVVKTGSVTVGNILKGRKSRSDVRKAGVYSVPCTQCSKVYIGETFRGIEKRLSEHKYDMKCFNLNNATVQHRFDTGHNANWKEAKMIKYVNDTMTRRCFESAYITSFDTMNQNKGFFLLARPLACLLLNKQPG